MKHLLLILLLLPLVACQRVPESLRNEVDRCNERSYHDRYIDIDSALWYAKRAEQLSENYADGRTEAKINQAFVLYQQMKFDDALDLLSVIEKTSRNQFLLLATHILQMKVAQRVGDGESFFAYRSRSRQILDRIEEGFEPVSSHYAAMVNHAFSELHIVSSTYYYYLGLDSAAQAEIQQAYDYVKDSRDTAQWLNYNYMLGSGGLVEGTPAEVTVVEFNHLFRVYTLAKASHFTYFEANALQSFASMVSDSLRARDIMQQRPDAYSFLYGEHLRWMSDSLSSDRLNFAAALAHHSVSLFRQYNDLFQTACALRTLGEVYFSAGCYDEALASFRSALHLASDHSRSPYQVTPWLAGIHENLSLTYSALGDKPVADGHRNTYLDLLDISRQDRELDSRKALLKQEAVNEQVQFLFLLLLALTVAILSAVYYRQLKRRSRSSEQKIRGIDSSEACQQVNQKLSELLCDGEERQEESREECQVVQQRILQQQERHIFGRTKLSVVYAIIPYLDRVIAEVRKLDGTGGDATGPLSYIQELCSGMMTVNDRLTSWIQMQQGKLSLQVTRFPLSNVLHVIAMQQYAFAQQQLTLEMSETELVVKADKPLTLFMVNTLVDNARKFTPVGGKVSVLKIKRSGEIRVGLPEVHAQGITCVENERSGAGEGRVRHGG